MKDIVEDECKEHEHYPMTWMNFNAQQYTQDRVGKQTHNNKLSNQSISIKFPVHNSSYLKVLYIVKWRSYSATERTPASE